MNRISGLFLASVLVLAACSGGDDDPVEVLPTLEAPQGEGASVASSDSDRALTAQVGNDPARSIEELEQQWEQARAATVARLADEAFGVDGGTLSGPGDLTVDLTGCPEGWIDTVPASRPITIAAIGSAADYDPVIRGMRAYFDHVNARGGVNGQQITLVTVDDQRTPTKTIEAVEDLLLGSGPLAVTTFGTTSSQAVFDDLNQQCVPQPFVGSAHPAWGDPGPHPWTTGFQLSYSTEAILWGNWLKRNLGGELPVTVGAMTINSDFGRAYLAAFEDWASANPDVVSELVEVTHAPDGDDLADGLVMLEPAEPEVVLLLTAGEACAAGLEGLDGSALADAVVFVPTACTDPVATLVPVGRAANDIISVDSPVKAVNDPAFADDLYIAFINEILANAGIDDNTGQAGIGAGQYGWTYVEALRIAAELDGGLSRSNLLLVLRSLSLRHPMLLGGIGFSVEGTNDAYYIEGGRMRRFSAGLSEWQPESLVVDINGATPSCSWNGQSCS
ncbi:MAG: ABC transporter substrate-binding protein [Acidimicrobiia bacterium]|nr:ABC transporter substrate-binding protein [Acidimicrobiia bacterium]